MSTELVEVTGTDLPDRPAAPRGHYGVCTCAACPDIHLIITRAGNPIMSIETQEWGQVLFFSKEEAKQLIKRLQAIVAEH